jgi:hypothetical protein
MPGSNEWWAALSVVSLGLTTPQTGNAQEVPAAALTQLAQAGAEQAGKVSSVNPATRGQVPAGVTRTLAVGNDVFRQEIITTDEGGLTQLLFLDQSSFTVGPNSTVTIDRFVYDPEQSAGAMALSLTKGLARFVGGKLSKSGEVTIQTPAAFLGIRGGITIVSILPDGQTEAVFLFGEQLTVTPRNGASVQVRRPGFAVTGGGDPYLYPPERLAALLARLEGPARLAAGSGMAEALGGSVGVRLSPPDAAPDRAAAGLTDNPAAAADRRQPDRTATSTDVLRNTLQVLQGTHIQS